MIEWLMSRRLWWVAGLAAVGVGGYALGRRLADRIPHADLALQAGLHLLHHRKRVLALGEEPGALERAVGGTLWRLKQAGAAVSVAVAVPAPGGGGRQNVAEVARRELEQAKAVLNYDRGELLPEIPGNGPLQAAALERLIRPMAELWDEVAPDLVLVPAAEPGRQGQALLQQAALAVAGERGETGNLVLYGCNRPNTLVDITRAMDQKWAGVRAYPSALKGPDPAHRWALAREGRRWAGGLPSLAVEGLYRL